ncbi:MAG: undecaprenyldiphospho-muramoylpentapeptide beta-N-acetylglucosaminyltransferase [Oscillospiraceae bacterium]|nr:undecaprenyldiphospho-muramoylpentapeptide beta-N-acetylglucosaminyltransferase [Oscillospiraceae bacterium]
MKVIFVGGGTSGHINPAINIANCLKKLRPDSEILYVGAKGGLEEALVKKAGFQFRGITVSGFCRNISFSSIKKNIFSVIRILTSQYESKKIIKHFAPDICIGTGGYVSGPFLRQAGKMGIKFAIHEQNAFPGLTTKLLAKKSEVVMLGSKDAHKYFPRKTAMIFTGNPLGDVKIFPRDKALKILREKNKNLFKNEKKIILSFGGSLGAKAINNTILEIMGQRKYNHIHSYGKFNSNFLEKLEKSEVAHEKERILIRDYITNMDICMSVADLVISRAGAMTISELAAAGKPAILIPSPYVAANHQYFNAVSLAKTSACRVIEEKNLNSEALESEIEKILENETLLKNHSDNMKKNFTPCAAEKICKIIFSLVDCGSKN